MPIPSKSSTLLGKKLHLYLKEKFSRDNFDAPNIPEEKTFENVKFYLKKCAEYKKTINKKSLELHLKQEKFLEQLHNLWIEKIVKGLVLLNWNGWLKKTTLQQAIKMSEKKEKFHEYLNPFHVFDMFVPLSMNKNEILAMFNAHPEIEEYWKKKEKRIS